MRTEFELSAADIFTLLNASLGLYAAVSVYRGEVEYALRLVILAGAADGMDGLVARRRRSSAFGENLDSLADAVSFCTVPAILVSALPFGVYAGLPFLLAGILRLARFNVDGLENDRFDGLPSTGAGLLVASGMLAGLSNVAAVALALALAPLMISTLPYWKPRGTIALPLGGVMVLTVSFPYAMGGAFPSLLLGLSVAYVVSGVVEEFLRKV